MKLNTCIFNSNKTMTCSTHLVDKLKVLICEQFKKKSQSVQKWFDRKKKFRIKRTRKQSLRAALSLNPPPVQLALAYSGRQNSLRVQAESIRSLWVSTVLQMCSHSLSGHQSLWECPEDDASWSRHLSFILSLLAVLQDVLSSPSHDDLLLPASESEGSGTEAGNAGRGRGWQLQTPTPLSLHRH